MITDLKQQFNIEVVNILCTQYGVLGWQQGNAVERRKLHISGGYVSKITLRFTLLCIKTTSWLLVIVKPC